MGIFKKKSKAENWDVRTMFGAGLNFATSEAYKLLRTNIVFSFPSEDVCRVIGVASAVQDEGKSSTSCNLAYALAETGASVLLLEADLRKPSIGSKLGVSRAPGLTNLLVSKESYKLVLQKSSHAPMIEVLTAGDAPPNPSELLGSVRMSYLIEEMRKDYDYVIVDLPPVTAVSDALTISKNLDGIVMVVRNGVAKQKALKETMRLLEMVEARVLGFVYRDTIDNRLKYEKKTRKGYNYYKYYREYGKKGKTVPPAVKPK